MKLLSVLSAGRSGVVAALLVAGATTVTVAGNHDTTGPVVISPGLSELAKEGKIHEGCERGKPVIVAQRNEAAQLLREAWQEQHQLLVAMREIEGLDHRLANPILRQAQADLKAALHIALDEVAKETFGREGRVKTSPTPTPTPTTTPEPTPEPECTPKPTLAPGATPTPLPEVVLDANLQQIVDDAVAAMEDIVEQAESDVAALPASTSSELEVEDEDGVKPQKSPKPGKPENPGRGSGRP